MGMSTPVYGCLYARGGGCVDDYMHGRASGWGRCESAGTRIAMWSSWRRLSKPCCKQTGTKHPTKGIVLRLSATDGIAEMSRVSEYKEGTMRGVQKR